MTPQLSREADKADLEAYIADQLRGRTGPERGQAEAFLRSYPGRSIRDWKGLGSEAPAPGDPTEEPWFNVSEREVRGRATSTVARLLPLNVRQAAGRDAELVWNSLARRYRRRLPGEERCAALGQDGDTGRLASAPLGLSPARDARALTPGGP